MWSILTVNLYVIHQWNLLRLIVAMSNWGYPLTDTTIHTDVANGGQPLYVFRAEHYRQK